MSKLEFSLALANVLARHDWEHRAAHTDGDGPESQGDRRSAALHGQRDGERRSTLKVFDLPKKICETSTDRAAGAAAGAARAVAESDHSQGTTAGLLSQGCMEQDVQGGFPGEGAGSLFPPTATPLAATPPAATPPAATTHGPPRSVRRYGQHLE